MRKKISTYTYIDRSKIKFVLVTDYFLQYTSQKASFFKQIYTDFINIIKSYPEETVIFFQESLNRIQDFRKKYKMQYWSLIFL